MKLFIAFVLSFSFAAIAATPETKTQASAAETKTIKPAFGGHCAMGLCAKKKVMGDEKYSVEYKGERYLFSSAEARDKFLSNIDKNIELARNEFKSLGQGDKK